MDAAISVDAASDDATVSDAIVVGDAMTIPDAMVTPDATTQAAMWRGAQMIEQLSGSALEAVVDMDGAGRAIVAWEQGVPDPEIPGRAYGELRVVRFDPATGWGAPVALTPAPTADVNAHNFDLAVNAAGDAMVVWNQRAANDQDVWVSRFTLAGGWEPAIMLYEGASQAQASGVPRVALAADGSAIALFSKRGGDLGLDSQLYARHFVPATGWGALTPVHVVAGGDVHVDEVEMDASGNAVAVATLHQSGATVWAARFSPAGGWTAPVALATEAANQGYSQSSDPRLALDPGGTAVVVFEARETSSTVWSVIGAADGTWHSALRLDDATGSADRPDVAIDAMGRATAVWQSATADQLATPDLRARRYTPGAGWSPIESVESSSDRAESPRVAMTTMGTATVVWQEGGVAIWAARNVPGAGWSAPEQISSTTTGATLPPAIAAGGLESFVATWAHDPSPEGTVPPNDLWANVFR